MKKEPFTNEAFTADSAVITDNTEEIVPSDQPINVLRLSRKLMVNNEPLTELPFDFEAIRSKDIVSVSRDLKSQGVVAMGPTDDEYLLRLFAKAVGKEAPDVTYNDLLRMGGRDTMRAEALTRSFFFMDATE